MTRFTAPAKIILFGEHAVVYGKPAIAVPVTALQAQADVTINDMPLMVVADDLDGQIDLDSDDALAVAIRLTLATLGQMNVHGTIHLHSTIPMSSGLGSGAAITTVLVRGMAHLVGAALPDTVVNQIVYEVEKIHHGTPSGIDNTVIVYGQAVYFVREQAIEAVNNHTPFSLLIGDTGKPASTKQTVSNVRRLYEGNQAAIQPLLDEIGTIAVGARQAMQSGDIEQLGTLMTRNHALLRDLAVSSPELDALVDAAMHAGASGAKLSGGGGGGNMIALVTDETRTAVRAAMSHVGAVRVIETTIDRMGYADAP